MIAFHEEERNARGQSVKEFCHNSERTIKAKMTARREGPILQKRLGLGGTIVKQKFKSYRHPRFIWTLEPACVAAIYDEWKKDKKTERGQCS